MTKEKKTELSRCLNNALGTLAAHTKGLTQDLDSESLNLHELVSNRDEETQSHLKQLDTLISDLQKDLVSLRSDLTQAQIIVSESVEEDGEGPENETSSSEANPESEDSSEPSITPKEASEIRHDEPVTLGTVIRSLLMADEPGQRERRDSL